MTRIASAVEARRNLGRFLDIVSLTNEDVIIARAGKPIARLTSCEGAPRGGSAKLDLRRAQGLGRDVWCRADSETYLAQERDGWD